MKGILKYQKGGGYSSVAKELKKLGLLDKFKELDKSDEGFKLSQLSPELAKKYGDLQYHGKPNQGLKEAIDRGQEFYEKNPIFKNEPYYKQGLNYIEKNKYGVEEGFRPVLPSDEQKYGRLSQKQLNAFGLTPDSLAKIQPKEEIKTPVVDKPIVKEEKPFITSGGVTNNSFKSSNIIRNREETPDERNAELKRRRDIHVRFSGEDSKIVKDFDRRYGYKKESDKPIISTNKPVVKITTIGGSGYNQNSKNPYGKNTLSNEEFKKKAELQRGVEALRKIKEKNKDYYESLEKEEKTTPVKGKSIFGFGKGGYLKDKNTYVTKDGKETKRGLWANVYLKKKKG
jgi:hypothetical protein